MTLRNTLIVCSEIVDTCTSECQVCQLTERYFFPVASIEPGDTCVIMNFNLLKSV